MNYYDIARENAVKLLEEKRYELGIWSAIDNRIIKFDFTYPRVDKNINKIEIGLSDVRSSDSIRVSFDFERSGWKIEQPYIDEIQMDGYVDASQEIWEEVGFFPNWNLEDKGKKII